ncbi:MAG TPA: AtpZ/AtpI family protein [Saprospiraceae bacterium]|nr:AtpZ/AtpI family protein [Saprospiraceae bacterium]
MTLEPKKSKKPVTNIVKYSSLGFQLFGLLGLCLYLGLKVDKYLGFFEVPFFTIGSLFLAFSGFMYKLIKELSEK